MLRAKELLDHSTFVIGFQFTSGGGHDYSPLPGDANLDGQVDFSDLLTLAQHYGTAGATWEQGDCNADGTVGFDDLLILAQHYGATVDAAAASPVPELSVGCAAILCGLALLTARSRRSFPFGAESR